MLPFCDRTVSVARKDVAPVWTRSFPVAKEPTTLGQHLRKKRFMAGMRQTEAAVKLGVSNRTLSLWGNRPGVSGLDLPAAFSRLLGIQPVHRPNARKSIHSKPSCLQCLVPCRQVVSWQAYLVRSEERRGGEEW